MRFLLIFLFTFLFSCNTTSINAAYKDYYKYQQLYISSILDNNKKEEINALKNLIECGKYLNFNTKEYEEKLKRLTQKSKIIKKTKKENITPNNKKPQKKYIKILSSNPFIITLPSNEIKHFILRKKINVFDIPYAIIPKYYSKKINNIQIKIAQFNKKTVRIAVYSPKITYKIENKKLIIYLNKKTYQKQNLIIPKAYKQKIIVIDPGHGGKDSGGIGIGHKMEKIAVLQIAKHLYNDLKKMGYKVYMTRYGDYFIPLRERTHFANQKKADLFISIHCNISPHHEFKPHGIETYFLSPTRNERAIRVAKIENKEIKGLNYLDQRVILGFLNRDRIISSQKLAIDVQAGMLYSLRRKYKGVTDGGVRPAPFWVLVGTQMPAILIETGYLTNPIEAKRLFNPNYQKLLAKGIAIGIYNYFRKNP